MLDQYPANIYNIATTVPGKYLQYYWRSTRQLFTVILDKYPVSIYNITA